MIARYRFIFFSLLTSLLWSGCKESCDFEITENSTVDNATLFVLAYPETGCKTTEASYSKLLPYVGIGTGTHLKAGHACMVIVKEGSETFEYFDFGRYTQPEGFGRARGANTDKELAIEVKARWDGKNLLNEKELLGYLAAHPEKTHGLGTLYGTVCNEVNYERVKEYIATIQRQEELRYGPFEKNNSNCARFVTGAMYHGILTPEIHKSIKTLYHFTPSVLGNIRAAMTQPYYYKVMGDSVTTSTENLRFKQYGILLDFGRGYGHLSDEGCLIPPSNITPKKGWQWLAGLGYGAWFEVKQHTNLSHFTVSQYNYKGEEIFSTLFQSKNKVTQPITNHTITYPTNYSMATLIVNGVKLRLERISRVIQIDPNKK